MKLKRAALWKQLAEGAYNKEISNFELENLRQEAATCYAWGIEGELTTLFEQYILLKTLKGYSDE
jgi:hypothetical protein